MSHDYVSKHEIFPRRKYISYRQQNNSIVFTILSAIKQIKLHVSSTIIGGVSLFGYVIYSSAEKHCWQCIVSWRIDTIAKDIRSHGAREME